MKMNPWVKAALKSVGYVLANQLVWTLIEILNVDQKWPAMFLPVLIVVWSVFVPAYFLIKGKCEHPWIYTGITAAAYLVFVWIWYFIALNTVGDSMLRVTMTEYFLRMPQMAVVLLIDLVVAMVQTRKKWAKAVSLDPRSDNDLEPQAPSEPEKESE